MDSKVWARCRGCTQPWQRAMDSQLTTCCTGCREGGPGSHLARLESSQQRQRKRRRASSGRHRLRHQYTSQARGCRARTHARLQERRNRQRRRPPWVMGRNTGAQQHQEESGTDARLHTGAIRCAPDLRSGRPPCPVCFSLAHSDCKQCACLHTAGCTRCTRGKTRCLCSQCVLMQHVARPCMPLSVRHARV